MGSSSSSQEKASDNDFNGLLNNNLILNIKIKTVDNNAETWLLILVIIQAIHLVIIGLNFLSKQVKKSSRRDQIIMEGRQHV